MKKIIITIILLISIFTTNIFNAQAEEISIYKSKLALLNMGQEEIFKIADNTFIETNLKNSFKDKKLQRVFFEYCKRRGLNYTDLLINAYKESNYREDIWVEDNKNTCIAIGPMCINIKKEKAEEYKYLKDVWQNVKRGINIMAEIKETYNTQNIEELIICYQYGYWYLEPFRKGEFVPNQKWWDRVNEAKDYVYRQIQHTIYKQIENNEILFITNKPTYNTHFPEGYLKKYFVF